MSKIETFEEWNHRQKEIDECNKTMSRQLTDIKMLHKKNGYLANKLDTKDARIEELEGGKKTMWRIEHDKEIQSLTNKLEVLTKCHHPERCPEWESYNKCRACQNKQTLENMESEG